MNMDELRERYGLAAESMAKVLKMSEEEFRLFVAEALTQQRVSIEKPRRSSKWDYGLDVDHGMGPQCPI